jgi:hypothetical protein
MRLHGLRICYAPEAPGGGDPPKDPPAGDPPKDPPAGDPPPAPEWLSSLPDDLKGHDVLKAVPDVATLAKRFTGAIELPPADAKPEDRAKALDGIALKLGMPEKAEDYKIPALPDGHAYTEEGLAMQAAFKPVARQFRLTQEQSDGIIGFYNAQQLASLTAETTALATNEADLRKTYGDKFDEKRELGNRALTTVLEKSGLKLDTFTKLKLASGEFMGDSKLANILFIGIGEALADTKYVGGGGSQPAGESASLADKLYTSMEAKKE